MWQEPRTGRALGPIFATITTPDYLPRTAILHQSLRAAYGDGVVCVALWVGDCSPVLGLHSLSFEVVALDELHIPTLWDMCFRYDKHALANALKPFLLSHILRQGRADAVIFLDADMLVYDRLTELEALLAREDVSIVFTPHYDRPPARFQQADYLAHLQHGGMNGGFVALCVDANATAFVNWWAEQLLVNCRFELHNGLFGDQRWLDLVPALFEGVQVLRSPAYNAAYWNYQDRPVRELGGRWFIREQPLKLFHFSQLRLGEGTAIQAEMKRLFQSDDRGLETLLTDYRERWNKARAELPPALRDSVFSFDRFDDGTPIASVLREAYADIMEPQSARRQDIFRQAPSFLSERAHGVVAFEGLEITELYRHIWRRRPDVHCFDLDRRSGQVRFLQWLVSNGARDHAIPAKMLEPATRSLRAEEDRRERIAGLRREATDIHRRIAEGRAAVAELGTPIYALLQMFAGWTGSSRPTGPRAFRARAAFAILAALRSRLMSADLPACYHAAFDEIRKHGVYLARKLHVTYPAFASAGALNLSPAPPMVEADALLNLCSVLANALEEEGPIASYLTAEEQGRIKPDAASAVRRPAGEAVPRQPKRSVILWITHFDDPETDAAFDRLAAQAGRWGRVVKVRQQGTDPSSTPLCDAIWFPNADLRSPSEMRQKQMVDPRGHLRAGGCDLMHMPLMTGFRSYDYVWFLEYDVDFSGPWDRFFSQLSTSEADVLGTTLYARSQSAGWCHWPDFRAPAEVPEHIHTRGFFPVLRLSQGFAAAYREQISRDLWSGHHEALYPTIALHCGLVVEDIGGEGPMVPMSRWGRFYSNGSDYELKTGSFRTTPLSSKYHPDLEEAVPRDYLCHPVKTAGYYRAADIQVFKAPPQSTDDREIVSQRWKQDQVPAGTSAKPRLTPRSEPP